MLADTDKRIATTVGSCASGGGYRDNMSTTFDPTLVTGQVLSGVLTERYSTGSGILYNGVEGSCLSWDKGGVVSGALLPPPINVASSGRRPDHGPDVSMNTYGFTNVSSKIPISTKEGTSQTLRLGTSNPVNNIPQNEILYSQSTQFPTNPHNHHRPNSFAVAPSGISTPVGSTFSISSRGHTSATAPSTTSSCSSSGSAHRRNAVPFQIPQTAVAATVPAAFSGANVVRFKNPTKEPQPKQPYAPSPPIVTADPVPDDNNVDRIDSALLSALCDPRERLGLLRLEKVLVDFMNEPSTLSIEVGGPYNSVVLGGRPGGRLSTQEEVRGRQTSFQRLCLHRLADRFNIVRENASSWSTNCNQNAQPCPSIISSEEYQNNQTGGANVPSLIRIVKVKNSRIPENLLIDLDVASYQQQRPNPNEEDVVPGRRSGGVDIRALSENFSSAVIGNGAAGADSMVFEKKASQKSKKKVMIMKRSTGSSGSLRSNGRKGDQNVPGRGLKGKNMSDKEKAYAEARARIFSNDRNASLVAKTEEKERRTSSPPTPPAPTNINPRGSNFAPSPPSSSTGTESDIMANTRPVPFHNNAPTEYEEATEPPPFYQNRKQDQVATATQSTNGAASKVTWRNRRQEENDPDFRRGVVRTSSNAIPANMIPHAHYGGVVPGSSVFMPPGSNSNAYHVGSAVDAPYAFLQQSHTNAISNNLQGKAAQDGLGYAQQEAFYRGQQHSNQTSAHHSSYAGQQPAYYGQQHHSTPAAYFPQEQGQVRHHRPNEYARANWPSGDQSNMQHGVYYGGGGNASAGRKSRDGITFQPEDFPALG